MVLARISDLARLGYDPRVEASLNAGMRALGLVHLHTYRDVRIPKRYPAIRYLFDHVAQFVYVLPNHALIVKLSLQEWQVAARGKRKTQMESRWELQIAAEFTHSWAPSSREIVDRTLAESLSVLRDSNPLPGQWHWGIVEHSEDHQARTPEAMIATLRELIGPWRSHLALQFSSLRVGFLTPDHNVHGPGHFWLEFPFDALGAKVRGNVWGMIH
jgi:hypothetical protein